jgi:hypothetical protein
MTGAILDMEKLDKENVRGLNLMVVSFLVYEKL